MSDDGFNRAAGQRVELRIGTLRVSGQSRIAARRFADALPAALEAALADPGNTPGRSPAERAAAQIVAAIDHQRRAPR